MAPAAQWTRKEEAAFVDFLVAHRAEAGDGCNFKAATFQRAAQSIAPLLQRGGPKTAKSCGNKYCAVRLMYLYFIWAKTLTVIKFRKIYRVIRAIQAVSGWTWDDETGASIDIHTASSWDEYVRVHPEAKPFRNKGWPYFRKMDMLMPASVSGGNAYHASQTPAPPASSEPPSTPLGGSDEESDDLQPRETPHDGSDDDSDQVHYHF